CARGLVGYFDVW
nr:immunoglobulin heavy chain junction region [Mus musculus]